MKKLADAVKRLSCNIEVPRFESVSAHVLTECVLQLLQVRAGIIPRNRPRWLLLIFYPDDHHTWPSSALVRLYVSSLNVK